MGSQDEMPQIHVFMVSFPGQGHVNPLLRLGKRLATKGILVTFSTPESYGALMKKANKNLSDEPTRYGSGMIRFKFIDDAWDYSKPEGANLGLYMQHLELVGKKLLPQMIEENEKQGRPVSCFINNPFIPWVSDVAETLGIPSAVLWVQSAASFSCYYHYLNKLAPFPTGTNPELQVQLPDEDGDIRGDLLTADSGIMQWLDSKSSSSVVYISFGSIVILKQEQVDELAYGLLNSGVNFLWVIKEPSTGTGFLPVKLPDRFLDKAGDKAKIVQWCAQEQVLAHPSLACFLTHCGWNSTMEAISIGTPIIAFPQWGDQVLDAKYLVDVFNVGIQLCRGENENRIIPREEVEKCVREAMSGAKAVEMKQNALKWKKAAEDAVAEGGSSQQNLQAFIDEIVTKCTTDEKFKKTSLQ
ncbi:gallate 1-beta-glucosyltransferase 84A23 isoform X2 [Capsicum galapagoense]